MNVRTMLLLAVVAGCAMTALRSGERPAAAASNGAALYDEKCAMCHEVSGKGTPPAFPPLAGNPHVMATDPKPLVVEVLEGMPEEDITVGGTHYGGGMPAWGNWLSDDEVASIVTYIRNAWGNSGSAVTAAQVARLRKQPAPQRESRSRVR